MSLFKLQSNYKPTGDQPKAIKQLTDGLKDDLKNQTLLGVTGSGKSVTADTPVLLRVNGIETMSPIGDFIDQQFIVLEEYKKIIGDTEVIDLPDVPTLLRPQIEVQSVNTKKLLQSWKLVYQLSRHRSPAYLYDVSLRSGRRVTVTGDHNFYVLVNGELSLKPTEELRPGEFVPGVRQIPAPQNNMKVLHLWKIFEPTKYVVAVNMSKLTPNQKTILKNELTYQQWYRLVRNEERLSLVYILSSLEKYGWLRAVSRIGGRHRSHDLPVDLAIDEDFCKLMGLYIAEGHSTSSYLMISNSEPDIVEWLKRYFHYNGVKVHTRTDTYDNVVYSKIFSDLLKALCGHLSNNKHLPNWWPQLSDRQLGSLLEGYFAGNGSVEKLAITASTSSERLSSDLVYALSRFNIVPRMRKKKTAHLPAHVVTIYGPNVGQFTKKIGMGCDRKQKKAKSLSVRVGSKIANTNVDLIPTVGSLLKQSRLKLGILQRELAATISVSRSHTSFIETEFRGPSINSYTKLLTSTVGSMLPPIGDLYWSSIKKITKIRGSGNVYDLAVKDNETFLAGYGGVFVHNTFTMANIIQANNQPTLVLSHNKTLAAQLYSEFRSFFPDNAVHYFVSYFDYYQPEAYIPRSDTYIEKDSQINEEIDRLRHAATDSLLSRRDVIIVASVSCIYGIGSVEDYSGLSIELKVGTRKVRDKFMRQLSDIQYQRNDVDFHRSTFRVRGDVVDVFPASEEVAYRIEFFGDEIDKITRLDPLTGEVLANLKSYRVFPGSHYVTPQEKLKVALGKIEGELEERLQEFNSQSKLLEAQRLSQRTRFDIEMLTETGFVKGIENYSRYLTNRQPGEQPATLLDYFPDDFLMLIDESHMTIPQLRGMYNGDRARKEVLVEHGFRLPSALDNRPLTFTEFERHVNRVIYVSATPAEYELSRSPKPAEQLIRPTGLLDPKIEVRPIEGQIDNLIDEIRATIAKHQRILITTLTKRMSEDLAEYLQDLNIKVAYLHSDVDTLDRSDILRDLRLGVYDVLVGINLLREGLDLPEVSLVAILDADKEGFLRSEQALIQTVGRAARHEEGRVLMYADRITNSMKLTIDETNRRRELQDKYNKEHGITPQGISKAIDKGMRPDLPEEAKRAKVNLNKIPREEYGLLIKDLTSQMELAAANLQFEQAAELRDLISEVEAKIPKNK